MDRGASRYVGHNSPKVEGEKQTGQLLVPVTLWPGRCTLEAVLFLLHHGADVLAHDNKSNLTPLHLAASSGHKEVVDLLIQRGAERWHVRYVPAAITGDFLLWALDSGGLATVRLCFGKVMQRGL